MKQGERIFFLACAGIVILGVLSVIGRYSGDGNPRTARDYNEWSEAAHKGYSLYKKQGCNSCHRVLRMGEAGVAPVLDGEGTRRSESWIQAYVEDPESMVPGTAHATNRMGPDFDQFSSQQKHYFVKFLASLKSTPGSANYPVPPFKP